MSYFVGLIITAVALGNMTNENWGFLTLGIGLIIYSLIVYLEGGY